jgi:hypothetical protein
MAYYKPNQSYERFHSKALKAPSTPTTTGALATSTPTTKKKCWNPFVDSDGEEEVSR